ncbi:MAG: formate--tetrahydrofolate ligase [Treponema sp.]|jgi:formate--tetrahydrofolate ligase|nr:formate--tetrahydrofolate ligase [Treponema sp.]
MLTDAEIARSAALRPIGEIAEKIGISGEDLDFYGKYKAKLSKEFLARLFADAPGKKAGKLILVTAINPTPAGEGKTTTSVGLSMALNRIGRKSALALREPSLGPVFGVKGGAAGGGYSQVLPMEEINLHFTGDFHAITSANNLLSAMIDNSLQQGNPLGIDPKRILFARVLDMNDRALRNVIVGLGAKADGVTRPERFTITVASEVMAILCLASDLADLKKRLASILVGYTYEGKPVYCRDLGAEGAMTALLRDALQPNLVQTIEGTPCLIHGGPFANIAHGCNSVLATRAALKLGDYAVTEAGFGADLGAEKFIDIKCRFAGLAPSAVVLVATVRALKYNGGVNKNHLKEPNPEAVRKGLPNLQAHLENLAKFGVPVVVAINHFYADTDEEIGIIRKAAGDAGVDAVVSKAFAEGGKGAEELARTVVQAADSGKAACRPLYDLGLPVKEKIAVLAKEIYGAADVVYGADADKGIREINGLGLADLPVCVAKTQYSLSDDASLLGRPKGFTLHVREVRPSVGAGFIVAVTGEIMTMPGLPKRPAALDIDVDESGNILGIF